MNRYMLLLLGLIVLLTSCLTTYEVPEEYLPDEEVVYLKQRVEFGPIYYEPEPTDPYDWSYDVDINKEKPSFIRRNDFRYYLAPNYKEDVKLFKEIKEHLLYVKNSEEFLTLKERLESFDFVAPEPREPVKGKLIKEYSNGKEYAYPPVKGATIIFFDSGVHDIKLPDGSIYMMREGEFSEYDKEDKMLYSFNLEENRYWLASDGYEYGKFSDRVVIRGPEGELDRLSGDFNQYHFRRGSSDYYYLFFIESDNTIKSHALINRKSGIRYDYLIDGDYVMVIKDEDSIVINSSYEKYHKSFDRETATALDILSVYYKEGLQITALDKEFSYSNFRPAWPEGYLSKRIGGFNIYYTRDDSALLSKLSASKLGEIYKRAREVTGMHFVTNRTIVLPPNLESYRKIAAHKKGELMHWYPSGYQLKDMIIMWPPSVKRYDSPEGERYFWENEFYEILLHELVHLIVGENSGIFSSLPVWLNEGLALYVEADYAAETKFYWEITFAASYGLKRLLPWDDVTVNSTSFYPVAEARVHYAQSYKMVSFLVERHGIEKVAAYVKSFKKGTANEKPVDAKRLYKERFAQVFEQSWEENLNAFVAYLEGR